jgi:cell surface protein SprA
LGYKFTNFSKVLGLSTSGAGANNDLNVTANFTLKNQSALLRKIEDNYTQATNGNQNVILGMMAEYTFSRTLTIKAYYDRQLNRPLISSTAYPVTSSAFGVSLQFSLNR